MSARRIRSFRETKPGEVWKSPSGWRAKNQDGVAQTFDDKSKAEQYAKGEDKEKEDTSSKSEQSGAEKQVTELLKSIGTTPTETTMTEEKAKSWVGKFLNKAKSVSKGMASVIKNAPLATKQFITDTEFRNKALKKSANVLRDNASYLAKTIVASTKSEAVDFARPFTAPVTILNRIKKGEKPLLTEKEKFSLYSGLVYWGCIVGSFSMSHMGGYDGVTALDAGTEIGDAFMHSFTLHAAFGTVATVMADTFKKNPPSKEEIEKAIKDGSIKPSDVKKAVEEDTTLSDEEKEGYLEQLSDMNDDPNKLFLFAEQIENTNLFLQLFGATGFIPSGFAVSTGALYSHSPWAFAKEIFSKGADVLTKLGKEDEKNVKEYENFINLYADQLEKTTDEDMLYIASLDSKPYEKITKEINKGADKHKGEEKKETAKKALLTKMARTVAIEYLSRQSAYQEKKKITNQDGKESTVYVYSDEHIRKRNKEKSKKVEKLRKCVSDFRAKYRRDIESGDERKATVALAVSLIDLTYERVGNPTSADNGHFGITGLQKRHIKFSSGKATLTYVGKSGVKQTKEITDEKVVSLLKEITKKKSKEDNIFTYGEDGKCVSARLVNAYLKDFGISAKDIRGFHANEEMKKALKAIRKENGKLSTDEKQKASQLKKEFSKALKQVASLVGHQHSTLKNQYLVPHLEETFLENGKVITSLKTATKSQSEKEDKQVEDIHKPNPKERPPRFDLRKRKIQDEDKDLDSKDKDLSLKHEDYKRASIIERVATMWLFADFIEQKPQSEGWRAKRNEEDDWKSFETKERAQSWLDEEDTEEDTEVDQSDLEEDSEDGWIGEDEDTEEDVDPKEELEDTFDNAKEKIPAIKDQINSLEDNSELSDKLKQKIMDKMASEYGGMAKSFHKQPLTSKDIKKITASAKKEIPTIESINGNDTLSSDEKKKALEKREKDLIQAEIDKMIVSAFLTNPRNVGDKSLNDIYLSNQVFVQVTQYDEETKNALMDNINQSLSGLSENHEDYERLRQQKNAIMIYNIMSQDKGDGIVGSILQDFDKKKLSDLNNADNSKEYFNKIEGFLQLNPDDGLATRSEIVRNYADQMSLQDIEKSYKGNSLFSGWTDVINSSMDPAWENGIKSFLADQMAYLSEEEAENLIAIGSKGSTGGSKSDESGKKKEPKTKRDVSLKDKAAPPTDTVALIGDFLQLFIKENGSDLDKLDETQQINRLNFLSAVAKKNDNQIKDDVLKQLKADRNFEWDKAGDFEINFSIESLKYENGTHWETKSGYGAKNKQGILRHFDDEDSAKIFAKSSINKTSSLNSQSFIYNSMNIDSDISINSSTNSIRRDNIMSKMNKQSALKVSSQLDRIASLFENSFDSLGVPKKIAQDFAYRCDLLSDTIESNFGINKQALDDLDPVLEPGFNPDDIGREVGGPLEDQGEHSWIDGEFSRQEHRELRQLQESGTMSGVQEDPRAPMPGKQAKEEEEESSEEEEEKTEKEASLDSAIARLSKQADMSLANQCAEIRDELKVCCIKLKESGIASVKSLSSACDKLVSALDKIKEEHIKAEATGADTMALEIATEKACGAIEEILPFVQRMCSSISMLDQDSPVAQFQVEEMLEQSSAKLEKLVGLAVKIVADALSDLSSAE